MKMAEHHQGPSDAPSEGSVEDLWLHFKLLESKMPECSAEFLNTRIANDAFLLEKATESFSSPTFVGR